MRRAVQAPEFLLAAGPGRDFFAEGHGTAQYGGYEFELGWVRVPNGWNPPSDLTADLKRNAKTLVEQAKDFGVQIIFLTYPSEAFPYGWANATIRDAAREAHAPLIRVDYFSARAT